MNVLAVVIYWYDVHCRTKDSWKIMRELSIQNDHSRSKAIIVIGRRKQRNHRVLIVKINLRHRREENSHFTIFGLRTLCSPVRFYPAADILTDDRRQWYFARA